MLPTKTQAKDQSDNASLRVTLHARFIAKLHCQNASTERLAIARQRFDDAVIAAKLAKSVYEFVKGRA